MQADKKMIAEVFSKVLETLAFVFSEPAEALAQAPAGEKYLKLEIDFKGHARGKIRMAVSEPFCRSITANILGIETEDQFVGENLEDGAKEMLNIVCGHVLSSLAGDCAIFDIGIPTVALINEGDWSSLVGDPNTVALRAEGHLVLVGTLLDGAGSNAA